MKAEAFLGVYLDNRLTYAIIYRIGDESIKFETLLIHLKVYVYEKNT